MPLKTRTTTHEQVTLWLWKKMWHNLFNWKVSAWVRTFSAFTNNWSPHPSQCAWILGYNPGLSSLCI